ncbi:MAG: CPBP family intramembrane glutamic endopeptidase [Candidatus Limnocylindrales bacterium]
MAGGLDLSSKSNGAGDAARRSIRPPLLWLAAGFVPVIFLVGWRVLLPPPAPTGVASGEQLAPVVLWRLGLAAVVLGSVAAMAAFLHADRVSLLLLWPSRSVVVLSVVFALVVGPLALWLGPILAQPFFGPVGFDVAPQGVTLTAFLAALVIALANGTLEELTFRGALMGWGSRAVGPLGANLLQAVVFGVVHVGSDFTGNPLPVMLAVGVGGLIAGVIAQRTRSLLLPIAVHAAFDLPLYYAFACRLG